MLGLREGPAALSMATKMGYRTSKDEMFFNAVRTNVVGTDTNLPKASRLNDLVYPPKKGVDPDCEEEARE